MMNAALPETTETPLTNRFDLTMTLIRKAACRVEVRKYVPRDDAPVTVRRCDIRSNFGLPKVVAEFKSTNVLVSTLF